VYGLVRDEGVAGSNPATPTNKINNLLRWNFPKIRYGDSYGDRNPRLRSARIFGAPARPVLLQAHDPHLDLKGQLVGVAIQTARAICERVHAHVPNAIP
jgi:hypothetical protein